MPYVSEAVLDHNLRIKRNTKLELVVKITLEPDKLTKD